MGKKITTLITGLLYGLSLFFIFYFYLILGIALGIGGKVGDWFIFVIYAFPVLAILAIVGAALAFKKNKVSGILLLIPLILHFITFVYLIVLGVLDFYSIPLLVLGLVAVIFAFLPRKEIKHDLAHQGNVKADKETMKLEIMEESNSDETAN